MTTERTEKKFKAWDTNKDVMFTAYEMGEDQLTILPDGRGFINVSSVSTRMSQVLGHMIPLQYVGKDKDDIEIYESDVVKFYHGSDNWVIGEVVFLRYGFYIKAKSRKVHGSPDIYYDFEEYETLERVGNVYETKKQLLKEWDVI